MAQDQPHLDSKEESSKTHKQSSYGPARIVGQTHSNDSSQKEKRMGIFEHLDELRVRLTRCLWVFFAGFLICYAVSDHLMAFLKKPLFDVLPADQQKLYFTSLFENFLVHLKISGYASLTFFSPYYFYEIWGFISPGLYQKERKKVLPFISAAVFFFLCGAAFAYYGLFPVGFKYFIQYGSSTDVPMLTIESYYSTCLKLIFLFGISFELPVVICLLGALGLVDAAFLQKQRRSAVILITIVAAFIAPPDAVSMLMLGTPLVLLYEASIFVVKAMGVKKSVIYSSEHEEKSQAEYDPFRGESRP